MKSRDIPAQQIRQMYDHLAMQSPTKVEQLRAYIRALEPRLGIDAIKRRVINELMNGNDRASYREMRKMLAKPMPEPRGSSPLERIKSRTAWLNPFGEQTGGNFRSSY